VQTKQNFHNNETFKPKYDNNKTSFVRMVEGMYESNKMTKSFCNLNDAKQRASSKGRLERDYE